MIERNSPAPLWKRTLWFLGKGMVSILSVGLTIIGLIFMAGLTGQAFGNGMGKGILRGGALAPDLRARLG